MSLFYLTYRDSLQALNPRVAVNSLVDELDTLTTRLSAWAQVEHNDDGTHNIRANGMDVVPAGGMIRWPLAIAPTGWLLCNGAAVSRAAYPFLFATLGTSIGAGDGSTTFNIPNVANFIILAT